MKNILIHVCVDIIIYTSGSNSSVERAFSTFRLSLSDNWPGMTHNHMEMVLYISINDENLSVQERDKSL